MWLVKYAVSRIVLALTRNSNNHINPREKLSGRKIDVDKEIKHGFGDYVQVHNDVIDNSTKPRTSGAIALMSSDNLEGSWYYMLLANEQIVKRTKTTVLPMPNEVILHLNKLALNRKTACKTKYKMSPSSVRSEGGEAAAGYCLNSVSYRVDEAVKYNVLNSD